MEPFPNQMLLSLGEVAQMMGISLSSWKRFRKSDEYKRFPRPTKLPGIGQKWNKGEVISYLQSLPRETEKDEK